MNAPFGEKIKVVWKTSGLSQKEFAEKLKMSLRNAQHLFERNDFSIHQLITISQVLNTDFVKMYLEEFKETHDYPTSDGDTDKTQLDDVIQKILAKTNSKNEINIQINLRGELTTVTQNFPDLLRAIKKEATARGLSIA